MEPPSGGRSAPHDADLQGTHLSPAGQALDGRRARGFPLARAVAIVAASTLAASVLIAVMPPSSQAAMANGLVLLVALGATAAFARSARVDDKRIVWGWLTAGMAFFALGEGYWFIVEGLMGRPVPALSPADGFYLIGYAFLIVSLTASIPPRIRSRTRLALDATVVFASLLAIGWIVFGRNIARADILFADALLASAYPALDAALATFLLFMLQEVRQVHRPRLIMLGIGLLLWMAVDSVYAGQTVQEGFVSGLPFDALWVGGYISFALAAWVRLDMRTDGNRDRHEPAWANALYLPLAALVPVFAFDYWRMGTLDAVLFGLLLVLVVGLAGRQIMFSKEILQAHRSEQQRARELEEAQSIARVGSWDFNLDTKTIHLSKEAVRIFRLPTTQATYDDIMRLVHPADRDRVEVTFWKSVQERTPFDMEHRIVIDGQTKVVRHIGTTHYAPSRPVNSTGTVQDITERKRADEMRRFQAHLLQAVDQTVVATDLEGRIIYWNDAAQRMYGWTRAEIIGQDSAQVMPVPESVDEAMEVRKLLQQGKPWSGELQVKDKGGRRFWVESSVSPFLGEGGELAGFIGIAKDITARKVLQADLQERVKELHALYGIATKISETEDIEEGLQHTVTMLKDAFLHDDAWIEISLGAHKVASENKPHQEGLVQEFRTELGDGKIDVRYRTTHAQQTIGPFLREEKGLLRAVADILASFARRVDALESLERREAALQETQALARLGSWTWQPSTNEAWWSGEMYSIFERSPGLGPLELGEVMDFIEPGSGTGALTAVQKIAMSGGTFDADIDIHLPNGKRKSVAVRANVLKSKAGPGAVVTGTMQDITSRVQAERTLHFQADLLATVRQAVFATDLEGTITFWNPAATQLFGWSQSEAVGRPVGMILGEQQTIEARDTASTDCWGHRKDGTQVLVQLSTSHLLDDGHLIGFIGIAQDVTKARAMQKRFQHVVNNSPAGIFQTNWKGDLLLANPAYARMAGYPSVEALMAEGMDVTTLYADPTDREWIKAEVLDHGMVQGVEFQIRRPDGTVRWVRADMNLEKIEGQNVLNGFVQDITEERQAKKRYQELVEHSPDGIFRTMVGGDLQYSNDAAAIILGYDSGEHLLATVSRVTDLYVDPKDRNRFIQALRGPPQPFETRFTRRDGSHVWIEIRARMHESGGEPVIEGTFRDLTDRRERDELVRRLAAVVEFSEEAIYTVDLHGSVTTWNAAAESVFGYTAKEAVGQPVAELIIPEDKMPEYRRFMEQMLAGRSIPRHDNVRRRKDGSLVDVSLTLVPIRDLEGRVTSISVSAHDISDRLQAEAAEKARLENEHLKELDKTLRDFINAAAHDLNQPLTPMKIALTTLEETDEPPPDLVAKSLKIVKRSVDRMELLVADLLDVARLESGTLRFDFEAIELQATLAEVKDFFAAAAAERGLDWQVESPPPLRLTVDPRRLMQVLFNLVGNAFKFVPEGGRVRLRAQRRDKTVRFEVDDNGIGLTSDQIARLFRPFTQVHEHVEDAPKGTGLGLYISKGIVEKHGGTIGVSSSGPGKGSTFWFEVPLNQPKGSGQPAPE